MRFGLIVLLLFGLVGAQTGYAAEQEDATDWTLLDNPGLGIMRLWALPDGTAFAADWQNNLFRSTDDGDTWVQVGAPPDGWAVAPDATDASITYGVANPGLYKSVDAGASWQLIRPSDSPVTSFDASHLAVSPVDHNLLYVVEPLTSFEPTRITRSVDGGMTWVNATDISHAGSPCVAQVGILMAHPTNVERVFSDQGCYAGRNFGTRLSQSVDQGATWTTLFPDGQGLIPRRLIGGALANPQRYYLSTSAFMGTGAARVYRSDDDGATWMEVLEAGDPQSTNFGGLAFNVDDPDCVFVATGQTPNPDDTGVRMTTDGGLSWAFLGRQDIGWVNDLVRLPDGTLLGATSEGIWRYSPGP
jgi:photosystem II stability/assembly factor-like uncharacterized protein